MMEGISESDARHCGWEVDALAPDERERLAALVAPCESFDEALAALAADEHTRHRGAHGFYCLAVGLWLAKETP